MNKIEDIEPLINMYKGSKDYRKPFGLRVFFKNGATQTFSGNVEDVLCLPLTKKQRKFCENFIREMGGKK